MRVPASPLFSDALLWCGSYTGSHGSGDGIGALRTDGAGGGPRWAGSAAKADSPSFLAAHPTLPVLYAVEEFTPAVRAFARSVNGDALEPFGPSWPAGAAACHIAVSPSGDLLVVACWGDGAIITYGLDDLGAIVSRHLAPTGLDPYPAAHASPARQSRAHASVFLSPDRVLTTDLGYDTVRVWRRDGACLVLDHEVALGAGTGPRHGALHPDGRVFILTEHSIEVIVLKQSIDGNFAVTSRGPATSSGARAGDAGAEISLNQDASRAYVTVRGSNLVSTLAIARDGSAPRPVGDVPSGGDWPRHHLLAGRVLHVANERSNTVTTFALDPRTGLPAENVGITAAPSPTCLLLS